MKARRQQSIDSPIQKKDSFPENLTIDSLSQEDSQTHRRCYIEDAKTKFGTFFFGLLLMSVGAALLYFGFRPEAKNPQEKTSRDNKLLLTTGFISFLLGLFCFVIGILMFRNVSCLYNDNQYQFDEDADA